MLQHNKNSLNLVFENNRLFAHSSVGLGWNQLASPSSGLTWAYSFSCSDLEDRMRLDGPRRPHVPQKVTAGCQLAQSLRVVMRFQGVSQASSGWCQRSRKGGEGFKACRGQCSGTYIKNVTLLTVCWSNQVISPAQLNRWGNGLHLHTGGERKWHWIGARGLGPGE